MCSDSEMILLLQMRNEQGIREIRDAYGKQCTALAYQILGSHEDAEECVSDALLTLWNSVPPQEPKHLLAYLYTLIRRDAIDRLKTANRVKRGGSSFTQALDELAEVLPSRDCVEDEIEQRELSRKVKAFLQTVSPAARRLFLQRYYLSMPIRDIAAENGMQVSAVKTSLMRTRRKLAENLEKEGLL